LCMRERLSLCMFLQMSLATALQRLGRFPQALRVLCDLYQREPFHPKLLFALFGSGVLTPEDELRLLRETKFDDSQLWASVNLTIQAIRAFRRRNAPLAFALCTLALVLASSSKRQGIKDPGP
ncbi:hypothetical protein TGMAS_315660B, partial [Toxoplasma gondii MAS]